MVDFIFSLEGYITCVVINFILGFLIKKLIERENDSWKEVVFSLMYYFLGQIITCAIIVVVLIVCMIELCDYIDNHIKPPKYL